MKRWKCDSCKYQEVVDDEWTNLPEVVCLKKHWSGISGADEKYKATHDDPWIDCGDYSRIGDDE